MTTLPQPEIERALQCVLVEIQAFYRDTPDLPVAPTDDPLDCRRRIRDRYNFGSPIPLDELITDVADLMRRWTIHVTHPRNFGNFNPSVTLPSVIGDTLTAVYNPQLAVWNTAPAAIEIEQLVLDLFSGRFGFDPQSAHANFTSGGAEANHSALIAALTHRFPEYAEDGLVGLSSQPVIYLSVGGHESFVKAAHATGIGRQAVRRVPADATHRMDVGALAEMINADVVSGGTPTLVIGTAGSTAMGMIDPLPQISEVCRDRGIWFHVDAAWGGAAILSDTWRSELQGIDRADSITCDAHKWLSVPMGAGMFFCRHQAAVQKSFAIQTGYMPDSSEHAPDPYTVSMQWSRRFIGLKLFMSLAAHGLSGITGMLEHHIAIGSYLREQLTTRGWELTNETPFPVICFTHETIRDSAESTRRVADEIVRSGRSWISHIVMTDGCPALKACVTSFRTMTDDVDELIELLDQAIV